MSENFVSVRAEVLKLPKEFHTNPSNERYNPDKEIIKLTRVPCIGERILWGLQAIYKVTDVIHYPQDEDFAALISIEWEGWIDDI